MNWKYIVKIIRKLLGLIAFIATGGGLIIAAVFNDENLYKTEILVIYRYLFAISLTDHFKIVLERVDKNENK